MHGKRDTSALSGERLDRKRLDAGRQVKARDLRHRVVPERTQRDPTCRRRRKARR
jgi:hypothetical protein